MEARPAQVRKSPRSTDKLRRVEKTSSRMQKIQNFRIWGKPSIQGSGEKTHAATVSSTKMPSGSLMGGRRSGAPENSKAASARAIRMLNAAMDSTIDAAAAKVSQTAARDINDCDGFMLGELLVCQSHQGIAIMESGRRTMTRRFARLPILCLALLSTLDAAQVRRAADTRATVNLDELAKNPASHVVPGGPRREVFDPEMEIRRRPNAGVQLNQPHAAAVTRLAPAAATPVYSGFQGLLDDYTVIPPDTEGAVGPQHVVTMLN